jgi:hypothetical protein
MKPDKLEKIATSLENGSAGDADLVKGLMQGLQAAFPAELIEAGTISSADMALALAARVLPGWEIDMRNSSAGLGGRWTCALREGTARDDDEIIGIGKGKTLALATLAALLHVAARRGKISA